jgi:hypothetical protein
MSYASPHSATAALLPTAGALPDEEREFNPVSNSLIHPTLKHPLTGCPLQAVGVVRGRPVWPILGGAPDDGGAGGDGGDGGKAGGDEGAKTFTQAELDAKISERLARERDALRKKYADYDDLKKKAEGSKTVEEQLAAMQDELAKTQREALRRTVQARHGISDEDAEVFLIGGDADTLEKQAKRLKELVDEKSKNGGRVPGEGRNGRPTVSDDKQAVRTLFGQS